MRLKERQFRVGNGALADVDLQGCISLATDVTTRGVVARTALARRLRRIKSCYGGIIRGVADPMFVVDTEFTIVYVNDAFPKALGYSPREVVVGMKCRDVLRADVCDACPSKQCMDTGEQLSGLRATVRDRHGHEMAVLCSASAVVGDDGQLIGAMEIIRDISADVRRENEVRDREAYYSSVMESVSQPMFAVDRELCVTWMNEAAAQATG